MPGEAGRRSGEAKPAGRSLATASRKRASGRPGPGVQESADFTIGKVARLAQVSVDAIRFYEKEGLLRPARKSGAGYRLYNRDAVRRLNFIKHAQDCGLALAEIRGLLELRNRDDSCCNDVRGLAIRKKLQLEGRIKTLKAMSQALSELIDVCSGGRKPLDECPILAALEASMAKHRQ
ncbi:MAG: heavy metal-responsive transcriptional regulator [Betaproteobacteria bacterium]|nr:heavy metal-responsive transcriptional regulator [Betaproteobacteria bacterium]